MGLPGLALMLLLAGCSDATENSNGSPGGPPPGLSGSYELQAPLTVFDDTVAGESPFHLRVLATGGSLVLAEDSTYQHQLRFESWIDGTLSGRSRWTDRGQWRARGDTLHFDSEYIGGLVFRGIGGDRSVTVVQDLVGEGTTAEYPFRRMTPE
jgi:hypothetical protein